MWLVTQFLTNFIYKITKAESVKKHIGENCLLDLCTTISHKVMAAIFQDGGHFQHGTDFLDSFFQACAILIILVLNNRFFTIQILNFDFRNSVKAYFTKYETKS